MTKQDHPFMIAPDCPNCDDGLVQIVWPPDNPETVETDCWFCETPVDVYRSGMVEVRDP